MHHIYKLKYPNYVIDKNKIEITNLHIILGLHGLAGTRKVIPLLPYFLCFFPAPVRIFDVNCKIFFFFMCL